MPTGPPAWRRSELFFRVPELMVTEISLTPAFHYSAPRRVFEGMAGQLDASDLSLDARRLLVAKNVPSPLPSQIDLLANWIEEVKGRIDARR